MPFHYVCSPTPFIIDISSAWIHTANIIYINKKNKAFFLKSMKYPTECMKPILQCMKYYEHPFNL